MKAFRVYVVLLVFSLNQKMLSRSSGADKNGRYQNQDQLKVETAFTSQHLWIVVEFYKYWIKSQGPNNSSDAETRCLVWISSAQTCKLKIRKMTKHKSLCFLAFDQWITSYDRYQMLYDKNHILTQSLWWMIQKSKNDITELTMLKFSHLTQFWRGTNKGLGELWNRSSSFSSQISFCPAFCLLWP